MTTTPSLTVDHTPVGSWEVVRRCEQVTISPDGAPTDQEPRQARILDIRKSCFQHATSLWSHCE